MSHPLRVLFIVQGEGRGHLTQAIALAAVLREAGHEVAAACVGSNPRRVLPAFFAEALAAPVEMFDEPGFHHGGRGINIGATLGEALRRLPAMGRSLAVLDSAMARYRPHLIVNFYTLLGGVHTFVRRPSVPVVCVGHQYFFHHPAYPFPDGQGVDRAAAQHYTRLTALGAVRRLALSFYPAPALPGQPDLRVMPPLLRASVLSQPADRDEGSLLVYLLNAGYAEEVRAWSAAHPDTPICCFRDAPGAPEVVVETPSLTFHQINGDTFIEKMARCHGLVCTAGFESVCEALYLSKPALMVPIEGHFEQQCNALDAQACGAGVYADTFDLSLLLGAAATYRGLPGFRDWVAQGPARYVEEIERCVWKAPRYRIETAFAKAELGSN